MDFVTIDALHQHVQVRLCQMRDEHTGQWVPACHLIYPVSVSSMIAEGAAEDWLRQQHGFEPVSLWYTELSDVLDGVQHSSIAQVR
jgi:hypothetical protein